ncbi:hypothetical protein NK211_02620 [Mammaliicoccus sciuri]|uniref:hypothetical protein n=1 Tax=Mammaliicoccus sciuri TaxID=1296 RepID=UPI0020A0DDF6|nr:hypothetical protein [Mammaliicoccus sciuri]MCP1286276.1 hypothetical protein [Mammaliicoccus sciuri]
MSLEITSSSDVLKANSIQKAAHDLAMLYLKDEVSKNEDIDTNRHPSLNATKIVEEYNHLRYRFIQALDENDTFI